MSTTINDVLRDIRSQLLEDDNGPFYALGQHIVLTIEDMIRVCQKFRKRMSEDDKLAVMSMVDVLTATAVALSLLKEEKDKAANIAMSGYNVAFAHRFFDLTPLDLGDSGLEAKVAYCQMLISEQEDVDRHNEKLMNEFVSKTAVSIIENMKKH